MVRVLVNGHPVELDEDPMGLTTPGFQALEAEMEEKRRQAENKFRQALKPETTEDLRRRVDALQAELERERLRDQIRTMEAELRRLRGGNRIG